VDRRSLSLALFALFTVAGSSGCDKQTGTFTPNLAPTVRLTHAPLSSQSREQYTYRMNWVGYDPDGRVDHFLYAIDPADPDSPDATWIATTRSEEIIEFDAGEPEEPINHNANGPVTASSPHVFAIAAVDNQGMRSPTVIRAFFSTTVAPFVVIESPRPSSTKVAMITPSVRIRFNGTDADGPTGKPNRYVYRLFTSNNPDFPGIDFINFATNPTTRDSMRMLYAPGFGPSEHCPTCTDWQSSGQDTTEVQYTNLVPTETYLFIVTGFDPAGAYDPVFSRSKNMLMLNVNYAGTLGPVITIFNEFFSYTYSSGGYLNDPTRYITVEVPADSPVTFNWRARPDPGADMRRYRWALDLENLDDETPRTNQNDWYHWSSWGLGNTRATIGPFSPPPGRTESHLFFVEAEDNNGMVSLGIVQFTVVRPTFEKTLLIVQDCRLFGDQFVDGRWQPPSGSWPNKAELDSFLYARGGHPWQGAYSYASNGGPYTSTPGIFNGYDYDTLSTRQYRSGIVPLATLGKYKYVIWYVDRSSALRTNPPHDPSRGMVALRFMCGTPDQGAPNTLATYLRQGGSAWLFGGGAATATLIEWDAGTKNEYIDRENELVSGRFMFDYAHWRTKIETQNQVQSAVLNWNHPRFHSTSPSRGWDGAPDYSKLLASAQYLTARQRGLVDDDPPPLRRPESLWYAFQFDSELLTNPNFIIEDLNGDEPGGVISTLDTVYVTLEGAQDRPIMTLYHGIDFQKMHFLSSFPDTGSPPPVFEPARFVFSGFPLWFFSRPQQIALVDFVLQDIWGLTREPLPRDPASYRLRAANAAPSRIPQRLAPQAARPLRTPGARR